MSYIQLMHKNKVCLARIEERIGWVLVSHNTGMYCTELSYTRTRGGTWRGKKDNERKGKKEGEKGRNRHIWSSRSPNLNWHCCCGAIVIVELAATSDYQERGARGGEASKSRIKRGGGVYLKTIVVAESSAVEHWEGQEERKLLGVELREGEDQEGGEVFIKKGRTRLTGQTVSVTIMPSLVCLEPSLSTSDGSEILAWESLKRYMIKLTNFRRQEY